MIESKTELLKSALPDLFKGVAYIVPLFLGAVYVAELGLRAGGLTAFSWSLVVSASIAVVLIGYVHLSDFETVVKKMKLPWYVVLPGFVVAVLCLMLLIALGFVAVVSKMPPLT